MESAVSTTDHPLRLLLALDAGFEPLAAVALCSFLLHNRFERVVVVTPAGTPLQILPGIAAQLQTAFQQLTIPGAAACEKIDLQIRPYFYCIEALELVCHGPLAAEPGRYLYVDADTLCVRNLTELARLPLSFEHPMAACSHGRPMVDRQLLLQLESPYHYFNAGILLFDSGELARHLSSEAVVSYFLANRALCRFREQCALNGLLRGKLQYLPNQYNYLSWMRPRAAAGAWHQLSCNPMAYCLGHVREELAIAHLSAGAIPTRLKPESLEVIDSYWLALESWVRSHNWIGTDSAMRFQEYQRQHSEQT